MKKPVKQKLPKKPVTPKGGIKTEAQLDSYNKRIAEYNKKVDAIDRKYDSEMKKYNDFQKRVSKAKEKAKR